MANRSTREQISQQIYSEIFPPVLSKGEQRRKEIVDAAIAAFAAIDYNHISYDDIARPAKTSRRLVQHYFPDKDELFQVAMKVVRAHYQTHVVTAISEGETPRDRFSHYLRSAISWPKFLPIHVQAWFLYFLVCAQQKKMRVLHEDLAKIGEQRIIALISEMYPNQDLADTESQLIAKSVQRLITGAVIEICSERISPDVNQVQDQVELACFAIINARIR